MIGESLEHFCYLLIKFGQEMEADKTINTSGQNLITSGGGDDERTFTATLSGLPLLVGEDGKHQAIDYLSLPFGTYSNGTGGDYENVDSWTQTLWLVLLKLHGQQLLSSDEIDNFSFDIEGTESLGLGQSNAAFSAEILLTLIQERTAQADGTSTYAVKIKPVFP